jgi:hypothetical protein
MNDGTLTAHGQGLGQLLAVAVQSLKPDVLSSEPHIIVLASTSATIDHVLLRPAPASSS